MSVEQIAKQAKTNLLQMLQETITLPENYTEGMKIPDLRLQSTQKAILDNINNILDGAFQAIEEVTRKEFAEIHGNNFLRKKGMEKEFNDAKTKARKDLYKKLALTLHPDRLQHDRALRSYFDYTGLEIQAPFQLLKAFENNTNLINEMAKDPISGFTAAIKYFLDAFKYIFNAKYRYPQPLKGFAIAVDGAIAVVVLLTSVLYLIPFGMIHGLSSLMRSAAAGFSNLVTSNKLDKVAEDYRNDPVNFVAAETQYLEKVRSTMILAVELMAIQKAEWDKMEAQGLRPERTALPNITVEEVRAMTREQLRQHVFAQKMQEAQMQMAFSEMTRNLRGEAPQVTEEFVNQLIDEDIRNEYLSSTGFTRVKHTAQAFGRAVFGPLPEGFGNKLLSIFVARPLQLALSPFAVAASAFAETLRYANVAMLLGVVTAGALAYTAFNIMISLPVLVVDGIAAIGRALTSGCSSKEEPDVEKGFGHSHSKMPGFGPRNETGHTQSSKQRYGYDGESSYGSVHSQPSDRRPAPRQQIEVEGPSSGCTVS
ncbi:hypothetical protein Lqui_0180 [Legionella quinlivanii]|uniref:Uncharacterized protein n=1 Tax=Legionella quinlivanii TaxID=45073 RepID=A0A0W0Y6S3_9GAMM|nr:hypothetical protein [Legionella quinlivanii]KTD52538.1 hypothetical protein Lqui_0180 [Legionella quinlivanii]MCW8452054.1 hypothetical protein [Legionella quinlivanii]SEG44162.1 hypothetical protein SAMN02746093_02960 [Legionella quinlivanii DSM 21216]STY09748.1 Uncharacterised protein [Legionella quinlivanii]